MNENNVEKELTQEQLAEKFGVSSRSVSRWENGDTIPSIDTLKLLSQLFDVSINALLGSPEELTRGCCGMTPEDLAQMLTVK